VAALREEMFRMGFLKVCAAHFRAGDLRGNRNYGNTIAVAIVEAIDQVQIARTAAAGAHRQTSRQMRFRARGKSRDLLMPYMDPFNVLSKPK
jgi:hypothetical protein